MLAQQSSAFSPVSNIPGGSSFLCRQICRECRHQRHKNEYLERLAFFLGTDDTFHDSLTNLVLEYIIILFFGGSNCIQI